MRQGFCLAIAVPSWLLGKAFPIIGGAVFAILAGMALTLIIKKKGALEPGIKFTSKKILQFAVVLLGFGMNLTVVIETGSQSLPIIVCTICTSLVVAYLVNRLLKMPSKVATLIGVGSSIRHETYVKKADSFLLSAFLFFRRAFFFLLAKGL